MWYWTSWRGASTAMRGFVGNTDPRWFRFLEAQSESRGRALGLEVNFWIPSGRTFRALEPGMPFIFRLKSPDDSIGGVGFYSHFTRLPLWLAWETFREGNGAPSLEALAARVARYRSTTSRQELLRAEIGCVILHDTVFFPPDLRLAPPRDWSPNIVAGKGYDLTQGEGRRLWQDCADALRALRIRTAEMGREVPEGGWAIRSVRARLGQGAFRTIVLDAYERACAVTEEHSLPVLEAAHIRPVSRQATYDPRNGVLLRSDLHRLFDRGYVTITPQHRFEVSHRLREDFENGRSYYPLHGRRVRTPARPCWRPDPELLRWHNEQIFLG